MNMSEWSNGFGFGPLYSNRAAPDSELIVAHDLPLPLLMNAIGNTGWRLLDHDIHTRGVLVGAKQLPTFAGLTVTRQGALATCVCGCAEGMTGTYTLITDVAMLELVANGKDPKEVYPRCSVFGRSDGRLCYVVPGDDQTRTPWMPA